MWIRNMVMHDQTKEDPNPVIPLDIMVVTEVVESQRSMKLMNDETRTLTFQIRGMHREETLKLLLQIAKEAGIPVTMV